MPTAPHTRMRIVQSRQNARVKELRAALLRPSAEEIGLEGEHLVLEALRSGVLVRTIFVRAGSEAVLERLPGLDGVAEILGVSDEILRSAVTTEAPQGIAALAVPPQFTLEMLLPGKDQRSAMAAMMAREVEPLLLVLAGLQDPGNVGTIVRSAEAFGADGVLVLPGTASIWNAKSLRASMGSAFRLPVVSVSVEEALHALSLHFVRSRAAVMNGSPAEEVNLGKAHAFWIGNEGAGLSGELVERIGSTVGVPCPGPVESLNAAVAASVLLYEAARQRRPSGRQRVNPQVKWEAE